jgi:enoyl-CoA hydratase
MHEFTTLILEEVEPGICMVTLNRPEKLNSINLKMLDEFRELFQMLSVDERYRVIIITGSGRGFCAGADLEDALTHRNTRYFSDPESFMKLVQEAYSALITGVRKIPQPVIAAVNGPAAGGGFCLAMASDIRIAVPAAYFVASFINLGLSGGELGSSFLLPRLVGLSRASEILLTGREVHAAEAERIGLVSRVVRADELFEAAVSCARQLLTKSRGGLAITKSVLDQNLTANSLDAAISLENRNQSMLVFSKEFFESIKAFMKPEEQERKGN